MLGQEAVQNYTLKKSLESKPHSPRLFYESQLLINNVALSFIYKNKNQVASKVFPTTAIRPC